jgi:hypothetical protein
MEDLLKIILPFLSTPKNYGQVLKRLASFAFYETYILTLILRSIPRFDAFFTGIEKWGPIGKVLSIIPNYTALNISGVVIAFTVAILTHMFQFHDRISDVLGIRRQFDRKHILIPMAARVGVTITPDKEKELNRRRDELMGAAFYRYASSRDDKPIVDKHDIEHALSAWSWFWVFVEAAVYWIVAAVTAWVLGAAHLGWVLIIMAAVFIVIAFLQRLRLPAYARPQIDAILRDQAATANVSTVFHAL